MLIVYVKVDDERRVLDMELNGQQSRLFAFCSTCQRC